MTAYHFVNPNLVTRDDGHVVAWDSSTGMPLSPDEQQAWREAGSPKPQAVAAPRVPLSMQQGAPTFLTRNIGGMLERNVAGVTPEMTPVPPNPIWQMGEAFPKLSGAALAQYDPNYRIAHAVDAATAVLDKMEPQSDLQQQVNVLTETLRALIAAMKA